MDFTNQSKKMPPGLGIFTSNKPGQADKVGFEVSETEVNLYSTKPDSNEAAIGQLMAKLALHQAGSLRSKAPRSDSDGTTPPLTIGNGEITPPDSATAPFTEQFESGGEVERLKRELAQARERIAEMDLERIQSHITRHTVEEAIGSPFPAAQSLAYDIARTEASTPNAFHGHSTAVSQQSASATNGIGSLRIDVATTAPPDLFSPLHSTSSSLTSRSTHSYGSHVGSHYGYTPPITPVTFQPPTVLPIGMTHFQQASAATRLSPTATEFPSLGAYPWGNHNTIHQTPQLIQGSEPLNYRRLLDRNVSCNWKFIVDKIIAGNDQQASIFLQQKLKIGTPEQKYEIVQAIIDQAYPLMINRFGNFLVQRCFEHGTPEQVVSIAQAIRGNTLTLSMDAFGCHVVQKAFDCVPEEYKAVMVHELLRRIPETVIHRYACHVWQKLFELRWSGSPPQIMKYVNESLRGMWHEVALGETGSLVVQNIFENCLDEDKRPCIDEVLASIDIVAHGQFGNWCVQHICEHGATPDRAAAIEHILHFSTEYSMDQFASKVVEKCLKIGGAEFLDRYLERVCEPRHNCPRMALIDIAGDQFGNYLIQYILTNADSQRREVVATQIRKHMVSLRGSKYGSRVAMLCSNPASSIRPGPPTTLPPVTRPSSNFAHSNSYNSQMFSDRYGNDIARHYPSERAHAGTNRGNFAGSFR